MGQLFVANKHILVVESHNDKLFIEQLIVHLKNINLEVSPPICNIDEYECLSGLSEKKLSDKLNDLRIASDKEGISKIGIMVDADSNGIDTQLALVNSSLKKAGFTIAIPSVNTWIYDESHSLNISCQIFICCPSLFTDCGSSLVLYFTPIMRIGQLQQHFFMLWKQVGCAHF